MPRPVEKACAFVALIGITKCSENQPPSFIFTNSMLSKKDNTGSIQRSRLPKNCRRLWTRAIRLWTRAMSIGLQPIRYQLENFLEFLGVEMLKIRGVLCLVLGAASDIFGGGRCCCGTKTWLRSQTLGFFASDPFCAF